MLRSSDGRTIEAHRFIIQLASGDSILQNHREGDTHDGLPVIDVKEDSKTIVAMLRMSYPPCLAEDDLSDSDMPLELCQRVWVASQEYRMSAVATVVKRLILSLFKMHPSPFLVYCIAMENHWISEARAAASDFVQTPSNALHYIPDMERYSAEPIYWLLCIQEQRESLISDISRRFDVSRNAVESAISSYSGPLSSGSDLDRLVAIRPLAGITQSAINNNEPFRLFFC